MLELRVRGGYEKELPGILKKELDLQRKRNEVLSQLYLKLKGHGDSASI